MVRVILVTLKQAEALTPKPCSQRYKLYALLKAEGKNYLCSVSQRLSQGRGLSLGFGF